MCPRGGCMCALRSQHLPRGGNSFRCARTGMPPRQRCRPCHLSQKKCDQTRPKCGRCVLKALDCTYVEKQDRSFVDQNQYSANLSRRRAARSARTTVELQLGVLAPGSGDSSEYLIPVADQEGHDPSPIPKITPGPTWQLQDRVLARFLGRWTTGFTCLGRQDTIMQIHRQANEKSPVQHAILAIAYADLAVNALHGDAAIQSCMAYHETLRQVKRQVHSPELTTITGDEFLTAILAIDAYEVGVEITHACEFSLIDLQQILYIRRPAPLGVHTSAIVELLRLRDLQAVDCWRDSAFERIAAPRILARQLLCGLPPLTRKERHEIMLGSHALDRRVAEFVNKSCEILHMLKVRRHENDVSPADREGYATAIEDLCTMLEDAQQWLDTNESIPRLWRVEALGLEGWHWPLLSRRPSILVCGQIWVIRDWILYHMTRIKILEAMIDESKTTAAEQLPNAQPCLQEIKESCNFLLDTMPFLVGVVDAKGAATDLPFNDTGFLIAHYPLWLIEGCKYPSLDALDSAKVLLGYIQARRSLRLQSSP